MTEHIAPRQTDYSYVTSAVCPRCEGKGTRQLWNSISVVTCAECGGSGLVVIVDVGGSFETRPAPIAQDNGRTDR